MNKSKRNIIFLIHFHLVVLLLPLLIKEVHHHAHDQSSITFHHDKTVSQTSPHCYICDFEYVSFVVPQIVNTSVKFTPIIVIKADILNSIIQTLYSLSSLRAPPNR